MKEKLKDLILQFYSIPADHPLLDEDIDHTIAKLEDLQELVKQKPTMERRPDYE